ncbi:hypothetical protein TRFO_26750 [Tritrichomonas foetus]|uniref:Protein kinase domain-containing protein n=1 Tax=Tritrichomonas foetus TaxID=1144522 RepID=A0A1J4K2Q9_9EUKA|nr:hypothetical protein TRFO_26750 [Tritrichomonas foetus]|eukprot:OHT05483.1 hypothetical protein TRFO_26750 [Tritrichomonas foetus]
MHRTRIRRHSDQVHKVHNYFVADLLGRGSFSLIYAAYLQKDYRPQAMKLLLKGRLHNSELGGSIVFGETVLLPLLKHPHIIDIKSTIETSTKFLEVMDIYTNGDLSHYIDKTISPGKPIIPNITTPIPKTVNGENICQIPKFSNGNVINGINQSLTQNISQGFSQSFNKKLEHREVEHEMNQSNANISAVSLSEILSNNLDVDLLASQKSPSNISNQKNSRTIFLLKLIDQVLSAIEYMHNLMICHRDIKPNNILISNEMNAILIDFGFADFCFNSMKNPNCGSFGYIAPEIVEGVEYCGMKADIWSIGVLIYTIFSKIPPRSNCLDISKLDYSALPDESISDLVKFILVENPKDRPNITQIRNHYAFNVIPKIPSEKVPDLSHSMSDIEINKGILERLSRITNKDEDSLLPCLKSQNLTKEKILYFLINKNFQKYNEKKHRHCAHICAANSVAAIPFVISFELEDGAEFVKNTFKNSEITIEKKFNKHWLTAENQIIKYLMNQNYCVSFTPTSGIMKLILNRPKDDIRIKMRLSDSCNQKGTCTIAFTVNKANESIVEDIDMFMNGSNSS